MANLIDADYEEAISNTFSNFRRARNYLLSPEKIKKYYDIIKSKFRYLHYTMATFTSSLSMSSVSSSGRVTSMEQYRDDIKVAMV